MEPYILVMGGTLVIGLGLSGQCQMSRSDAKQVRRMTESKECLRGCWSNEERREGNARKAGVGTLM